MNISIKQITVFFILLKHDSFISALLTALNNFDFHYPPYGSAIIFEVYTSNDIDQLTNDLTNQSLKTKITLENTFIKFYYLKHTETNYLIPLSLIDCQNKEYCSFKEFFNYVEDITITKEEWYKKCDKEFDD